MLDSIWQFVTENQCGAIGGTSFLVGVVLQKYVDVLSLAKVLVLGRAGAAKELVERLAAVEEAVEKALAEKDKK